MKKDIILIGICGKMGCGKNYISEKYLLPILKSMGFIPLEMSLADQIKINVMTKDNLQYEELYVEKSDKTRTLLQYEGTECGRQKFGEDIWIRYINNWISIYSKRGITAFIVPDIRFKNEADWIKESGGILIKVVAPDRNEQRLQRESRGDPVVYKRIKLHASETEIDNISDDVFDLIIDNTEQTTNEQIINITNEQTTNVIQNLIQSLLESKENKNSKTIVQKYGGTSIGTPEKMKSVVDIIKKTYNSIKSINGNLYVVVSAISSSKKGTGTTSQLLKCTETTDLTVIKEIVNKIEKIHIEFAEKMPSKNVELLRWVKTECEHIYSLLQSASIIGELSIRSRDVIISKGEMMSARILYEYLKSENIDVDLELINNKESNKLNKEPNKKTGIFIFGGYTQNELTKNGVIETVGRGYSDYTAGLIAHAVGADELQIWKEVDGIYTADPNIVLHAKLLKTITKQEAAQLTYYGCQAINPLTIELVKCPIRIKNCNNPDNEGTLVINEISNQNENQITTKIKGKPIAVTTKENICVINISSNKKSVSVSFFSDVFGVLKKNGIIIDLVSTSQVDISVAIESIQMQKYDKNNLITQLSEYGNVDIKENMCILSIIGQNMKSSIGIAGKMFKTLSRNKINIEMISQGASEINISCVIKQEDSLAALCHVHYDLIV